MNKVKNGVCARRMRWIFSHSGILTLAFEHFLAMIPATILVPIMVNNTIGATVVDMSLVLLTSGLGTIAFSLISGRFETVTSDDGKNHKVFKGIPAYLSSSFAYIGITIYLIELQMNEGVQPGAAFAYVGCAYFFSGLLLAGMSVIYKFKSVEKFFTKGLPPSVIGPAISLIGLELADTAVADAGVNAAEKTIDIRALIVALVTLSVIILFSLLKKKFVKNAAIIIGMLVGYITYIVINGKSFLNLGEFDWNTVDFFILPKLNLPLIQGLVNFSALPRLFISIIPATLIVFTENIGRITVINRMQINADSDTEMYNGNAMEVMRKSIVAHGLSSAFVTAIGSIPNTIYAENIAVMSINKTDEERKEPDRFIKNYIMDPFSVLPYWIAALLAIVFAFIGPLQNLVVNIPKPVIGGMELFLFGIISAPGIQLLVDQRVNYKKVSNQIITAAVLITGISELSIDLIWFELKGMSLGLVTGCLLNAIVLLLERFGVLCDLLTMEEVLSSCISVIPEKSNIFVTIRKSIMNVNSISVENVKKVLSGFEGEINIDGEIKRTEFLREAIEHSSEIDIRGNNTAIKISKKANRICIDIRKDMLLQDNVNMYLNDYQDAIDLEDYSDAISKSNEQIEYLVVDLSRSIPMHKVCSLIKQIKWEK